jgi:peptidoglycan hydrolase-like protein with peptidoglycan-binding domain
VLELQSRLNWLGYGCTPEDGYYGPETASIVRQFQSDYGLVVDGEVGPQTWNALFGVYD